MRGEDVVSLRRGTLVTAPAQAPLGDVGGDDRVHRVPAGVTVDEVAVTTSERPVFGEEEFVPYTG